MRCWAGTFDDAPGPPATASTAYLTRTNRWRPPTQTAPSDAK